MDKKEKVLIVEDEKTISSFMQTVLSSNGYDVLCASNGSAAYAMISSHCPDVVILDLGLPDIDGLDVLKAMRQWTHMPVIVVSARSHERDKVEALDMGADDYITKPFSAPELLARIRTAIRHTRVGCADESIARTGKYTVGELTIDYDKRHAYINGEDAHLTQSEFRLVGLLGRYAGKVLTYDSILRELWGPGSCGNNQILRVNMANIRRKLEKNPAEPKYIFTEVGVGYWLTDEMPDAEKAAE